MNQNPALVLDGKVVRCWLFNAPIRNVDGTRAAQLCQVWAFDVDHALRRLVENFPMIPRKDWEMIDELDAEHDVGQLGRKLPLFPMS